MLLLLLMPVLFLVTRAHRYLQVCAPSNAVIVRARTAGLRWRAALQLATLAAITLVAMHLLAEAVASGAPAWLNLGVLVLAWDAIKFGVAAAVVAVRCGVPVEAVRARLQTERVERSRDVSRVARTGAPNDRGV